MPRGVSRAGSSADDPDAGSGGGGGPFGATALPAPVAERLARFAHELRNPLNTIAMNAELLSLVLDDDAPPELGDGIEALERAVGELGRGLAELDAYVASQSAGRPGRRPARGASGGASGGGAPEGGHG